MKRFTIHNLWTKNSFWFLLFAVVLSSVFGKSASFPLLMYDDRFHICTNPYFSPQNFQISKFWTDAYLGLYAPATYSLWGGSVALSRAIWGESSTCSEWGSLFHALNLLLHLLNTFLVFLILKKLSAQKSPLYAAAGALLFLVHPLQVETVAWVANARDLLSGTLGLLGIYLYLKGQWKTSLPSFMVSSLAKATGMVFSFVALTLKEKENLRQTALRLSPALLFSLGIGLIAKHLQADQVLKFESPLWSRPFLYAHNLGFYFEKFLMPFHLTPDYSLSISSLWQNPATYWRLGFFVAAAVICWFLRKSHALKTLFWVLLLTLPISGLISFGFQEVSVVADRYFYPAMLAMAFLFSNILITYKNNFVRGGAIALVLAWSAMSFSQIDIWQSDEILFQSVIQESPKSTLALQGLGSLYFERRDFKNAETYFKKSLELGNINYLTIQTLGMALESQNKKDEAESLYRDAIRKNVASAAVYSRLGSLLFDKGNIQESERSFIEALQLDSSGYETFFNLGILYLNQHRMSEAKAVFQEANKRSPNNPNILKWLSFIEAETSAKGRR